MAGFPEPEAGLVISYSYLWKEEEERGQTEGRCSEHGRRGGFGRIAVLDVGLCRTASMGGKGVGNELSIGSLAD